MYYDAELRNWSIIWGYDFESMVVRGLIYNDKKKRFEDGEVVRTSSITKIDLEHFLVFTKNSCYKLT